MTTCQHAPSLVHKCRHSVICTHAVCQWHKSGLWHKCNSFARQGSGAQSVHRGTARLTNVSRMTLSEGITPAFREAGQQQRKDWGEKLKFWHFWSSAIKPLIPYYSFRGFTDAAVFLRTQQWMGRTYRLPGECWAVTWMWGDSSHPGNRAARVACGARFGAIQSSDRACSGKAKRFTLPENLFGLWIKWSPGLGGGATSCPCLASKGSYSFPS